MIGDAPGPKRTGCYDWGLLELTLHNAADYLAARDAFRGRNWRVTELAGGISNIVLLAESDRERLVLKQSLPKLRVKEDWPADRNRIEREWLAIQDLEGHLPAGAIPEVYFTDAENFLFAMSAAPAGALTWKTQLLDGICEPESAVRVAQIQAAMMRASWQSPLWQRDFGDLNVFEQLRLNPYHAFTASRHPDLAEQFAARADEARTRRCCAVHGDWSPKNFLVHGKTVTAIDWEVIHYGDPSFDAAFALNHLLLKAFRAPAAASQFRELARVYWEELTGDLPHGAEWFEEGACRHLGCLLLARVDGKSPAEYITDEATQQHIRNHARRLILDPPAHPDEAFEEVMK
jgi:5-methylthioribose kinase